MNNFSCSFICRIGYIQGLSCPAGEHPYSCFSCLSFVTDITLDYTSARQLCQSRQGDLVNVEAAWEAEVIRRYLRSLNESREVWIGRYRNNTGCYAAQRSETIIWDSIPCTLQRPFVCVKTYGSGKSSKTDHANVRTVYKTYKYNSTSCVLQRRNWRRAQEVRFSSSTVRR